MTESEEHADVAARRIRVGGVVQGVGFRPFVYRLAHRLRVVGWVLNETSGVVIHAEGAPEILRRFIDALRSEAPPAAVVSEIAIEEAAVEASTRFEIRDSTSGDRPTARIAPDLAMCADCRCELSDPTDRRYGYPYLNCTNCGPRYSIITALPYDRAHTTMRGWAMCSACSEEYEDPLDRRFHAQPTACPVCGPQFELITEHDGEQRRIESGRRAIEVAARMLRKGKIVAVKGLGGYHLVCDARNEKAVRTLRERKFRKEKPFALMVATLDAARCLVRSTNTERGVLQSTARPIVLLPMRTDSDADSVSTGVAPGCRELGIMLPYTPLHVMLFACGAPDVLVMTSANRSSEPIAYQDEDAFDRLAGLADAFLVGERPIARRVDDSVLRVGPLGPVLLRWARGYAPSAVSRLPTSRPILAVGADLKNTVTLVVEGQAFVSQFIGDLEQADVQQSFEQTIEDLCVMYAVPLDEALVVHDAHPHYRSTLRALDLPGTKMMAQHHRAHVASVLAEREAWDKTIVGFAFDGTGYGDDGSVWGGEVFVGSLRAGFERAAHLLPAFLPGGDAAARVPVQAAAGFLVALPDRPDVTAPPFDFPPPFGVAVQMVEKGVRTYPTTSMGRLFDTVAALVGFTRAMTFEGQAAIWLEHLARTSPDVSPYPFPELDYRPLLRAVVADRLRNRPVNEIARAFHAAVAQEIVTVGARLAREAGTDTLVLSGGVFQNVVLLRDLQTYAQQMPGSLVLWMNHRVPPNDGGISLGQAALAACADA